MNSQQFDDIIKNKAHQREADVPEDIWEEISKKKKKRRFPFFWFILLALLLGGVALTWKMNNNNSASHAITAEKTNNQSEKLAGENIQEEKTTATFTLPNSIDKVQKENNDRHTNNISSAINDQHSIDNKNGQQVVTLNKNEKSTYSTSKKNSIKPLNKTKTSINKYADPETEELFTNAKNKRKTGGKTKTTIVAGEFDSLVNTITNDDELVSTKKAVVKTDADKKLSVVPGETTELSNTTKENTETADKKTAEPVATDSLVDKKAAATITNNPVTDTTKKQLIASKPTKKTEPFKKGLKIEVGFTLASTMQEYDQPLYVKRTISTAANKSEFISDKMQTTIEPGFGMTVSLVKTMNKKWNAGVGLNYLRITERLHFSGPETHTSYTIVKRLVQDPSGSYLRPDTISVVSKDSTTINGRNIYNSFSIPVFVRYKFIDRKKWSCSFTTGLYFGLLTKYHNSLPGKFETVYASNTNGNDSKNAIAVDVFAGLHFSGMLWKKMEWFAEPGFRYNISKYGVNNLTFNKKIHSAGIYIGIAIPLKK